VLQVLWLSQQKRYMITSAPHQIHFTMLPASSATAFMPKCACSYFLQDRCF